jgi:thiamine-phosphate pyrophosphorylase
MRVKLPRLYAILDPHALKGLPWVTAAEQLFDGGVRLIQLRNKQANTREFYDQAVELARLARRRKCKLIVNDRADVAWLARAHGVHVGQEDLSVKLARKILGPEKIIGISTHNLEQALAAEKTTATYIAVGPIFETKTKEKPSPVVGLAGLKAIRQETSKPIVAIGGITLENAVDAMAAGADAVAVISDLLAAQDIAKRAGEFVARLGK